jgi:hypothetical protein
MRRLVLTIAIGDAWRALGQVTHPLMREYAARVGADFRAITEPSGERWGPHWEKLQIYNILGREYDRVIYLDTDCVLRPDCPDLFEVVPESKVGAFNEGLFMPRTEVMRQGLQRYVKGDLGWDGKYWNTGVMVLSRKHRHIFKSPGAEFDFANELMFEQTYLNVAAAVHSTEWHDLRYELNYMPSMQHATGLPMEAGKIAHFAGIHPAQARDYAAALVENWRELAPDYRIRRRVWVDLGGGLGDVIDAEPVLRYALAEIFPGDDVRVTTPWPRVFQGTYPDEMLSFGPESPFGAEPAFQTATVPADATAKIFSFLTHVGSNGTDFASIGLLHMQLPAADKQIRLTVTPADDAEIDGIADGFPLSEAVLIHPGRTWESRTFPVEWWQAVIDGIAAEAPVVLFGLNGEIHGVLPVECPANGLDARDRTTMGGMFALVRRCPVLLTNDSSPVHVAGAFDNGIVLIPSVRHPDLILPTRHGNPYWRASALYKKLTLGEVNRQPCEYYGSHANGPPLGPWTDYLPETADVIAEVLRHHGDTKLYEARRREGAPESSVLGAGGGSADGGSGGNGNGAAGGTGYDLADLAAKSAHQAALD